MKEMIFLLSEDDYTAITLSLSVYRERETDPAVKIHLTEIEMKLIAQYEMRKNANTIQLF